MNNWREIFKVGVNTKSCVSMRKHMQKQAPKFAREPDTAFKTKRHFLFAWTRRVVVKNWPNTWSCFRSTPINISSTQALSGHQNFAWSPKCTQLDNFSFHFLIPEGHPDKKTCIEGSRIVNIQNVIVGMCNMQQWDSKVCCQYGHVSQLSSRIVRIPCCVTIVSKRVVILYKYGSRASAFSSLSN